MADLRLTAAISALKSAGFVEEAKVFERLLADEPTKPIKIYQDPLDMDDGPDEAPVGVEGMPAGWKPSQAEDVERDEDGDYDEDGRLLIKAPLPMPPRREPTILHPEPVTAPPAPPPFPPRFRMPSAPVKAEGPRRPGLPPPPRRV